MIPAVNAVVRQLAEIEALLKRLDDDAYVDCLSAVSGTIGAHVRHALDHIASLVEGIATGECAYDRRVRGTDVERVRLAAIRTIRALSLALTDLDLAELRRPIVVRVHVDRTGRESAFESTVERELAFLLSHTVHHNAIIALLLEQAGIAAPHRFGVAVSTPAPALAS